MKHLSIPLTFLLLLCVPRLAAGQTPEANFGITNNHFCVNDSILISFSVPSITEYSYTISHTSPISSSPIIDAENVSHTITNINIPGPSASGTYQYSLDLYDSISLIHYYYNSIANITFHPRLDTVLILADDTNYCQGRSNIIRSNINNTNFTYEWYYSLNGSSGNTITNAGSTLNLASTSQNDDSVYYILFVSDGTLYARTPNSCASGSDTILIRTFDTITDSITIIITDTANVPKLVWNQPAGDNSQHRGYQYQWQYRHDTTHVWTPIANANSTTYNLPLEQNSIHYRLKITSPCDSVESNSISSSDLWDMYNIIIDFVTGGISGDSAICYGDTPRQLSVRTLPSFISGARYVWQKKAVTGTSWDSCYDGRSYTPNPAYNDTMYRVQIKNTSGNVLYTTDSITIHVYTQLTTPHITAVADTVCYDTSPNLSIDSLATGEAPISHQWQIYNSSSGWTNITNQNTPLRTTTSFRVIATDANNCQKISNSLTITVIPPLIITSLSIELDTSGTNPILTSNVISSSSSSTYPYKWQYRASPTGSWTPILNANDSTYMLDLSIAGEYRLIISNSCKTDSSNIFHTSSLWSGYQISRDDSVCYGVTPNPLTIRPLPSYIPNIRYVWQEKTTTSNWSDCSDTGRTHRPGVATTDKYYRVSIVMNTNNDTLFTTNSITIHVYPQITQPTLSTTDDTICFNTVPPSTISITNPETNLSYQWQKSNDTINWTTIDGATNTVYTPTDTLTRNTFYRVRATNPTTNCSTYSDPLMITVLQKIDAGSLDTSNSQICRGSRKTIIFNIEPSGGNNSYTYIWQASNDSINFTEVGTTEIPRYTTEPLDTKKYFRVIVASTTCSIPDLDTTDAICITVWNLSPAQIPSSQNPICKGNLTQTIHFIVPPQYGSEPYSYKWQFTNDTNASTYPYIPFQTGITLTSITLDTTTYIRVECHDQCSTIKYSNWCKIEVKPLPQKQILDDDSRNNTKDFCTPGKVDYVLSGSYENYTYSWSTSLLYCDSIVPDISNPRKASVYWKKAESSNSTFIKVTTKDNTTYCYVTDTFNIYFNPKFHSPDPTIIKRKKSSSILICADTTPNAHYSWGYSDLAYPREIIPDSNWSKRYFKYDKLDTLNYEYFVKIYYEDISKCITRSTYKPETDTPNANDASPASLTVSPNPSQGEVNYSLNQSIDGDCLIQIFDATGHLVYTQECSGYVADTPIKIDTQLKQGIYILSLTSEKIMLNKKIIVQ